MRIGIVTTWFERGAAYVSRQYRDALNNGNEVFIYARGGERYAIGDKNWDEPCVTWGKKIPIHMPMSVDLADFKKWIIDNELDIILFNEQQWWDPVILCNKMGIKTGAYIDYYTKETIPFFGLYDFLLCNTKRHCSVFYWHPQTLYIPWGADLALFKPASLDPVQKGFTTFFHSAGVSPERKGTDIAIKAFNEVAGPARLVIHTQCDIEVYYPELKSIIAQLTRAGKLQIIQKTIAAPGLYHTGDVYVYPSRLDGIGLSLSEALGCGLPVITSNNPPMNEFVDSTSGALINIKELYSRKDGYYWPMCNPSVEHLQQIMQRYVDEMHTLREKKISARIYAERYLDWAKNSTNLSESINQFNIIPLDRKNIDKVVAYEQKRSNMRTRLYRLFPWIYVPFVWLWPFIIKRYITRP